ncbi:GNAT family N-acetyltransferase [Solibacillus daqui]|uniref:GNAT family N-acetyltransferase n=1 Tax=Solibacillus daqui TaxID=2912187 RepID=UPI002366BC3A|nr:GNAT family N-acetyltransferase [Solibacillus daqui]
MKKMEKKYIPLAQFFETCTQSTFTLTYEEIQNIMGHELPNAAYLNVSWWKKTKAPSTHFFAWINCDYYVTNVTLGHSVTFSSAEQDVVSDDKPQSTYITRPIEANDARAYINLQEELFAQSPFGYYTHQERNLTVQQVRKTIADWRKDKTSTILLCIYNGQFAGYTTLLGNTASRTKHIANVRIAIHNDFQQKGLATVLLKEAEKWARTNGISRFEASVTITNTIAHHLFDKLNYSKEGTRTQAIKIDEQFVDEVLYSKIF